VPSAAPRLGRTHRSSQGSRFPNSPSFPSISLFPQEPCGLPPFISSFYSFSLLPHRREQSKRPSSLLVEQALHLSRFFTFLFLPAHRNSPLVLPYSPNHAPSNISPLPLPRFLLGSSRSPGLRGTRTLRLLLDRDTLPSPGERKSGHSASGHSDGADD
jgi:hypothetical protein